MIKLFEISTVENCDSSIIPGATNISRTTEAHEVFLVTCQDGRSHQLSCENSAWVGNWRTLCHTNPTPGMLGGCGRGNMRTCIFVPQFYVLFFAVQA